MLRDLQSLVGAFLKHRAPHSHGLKHLSRVVANTKAILAADYKDFPADWKHDCVVLAWTHDLEDPKYKKEDDDNRVEEMFSKFLKVLNPSQAREIITRSSWNEQRQLKDTKTRDWEQVLHRFTVFRHILSDADKLDAMDDQGLERCAHFVLEKNPQLTDRDAELYSKVHQHAQEKLLRIPEFLHSPSAHQKGQLLRDEMRHKLKYFQPEIENKQLPLVAAGLNIEGGRPMKQLTKKQIWGNLVVVLDHPLQATVSFDELFKQAQDNKYPLLENVIDDINERQLLVAYLSLLYHYAEVKRKRVLVHVHQFPQYAQHIIRLLQVYWDKLGMESKILYLHDTPTFVSTSVEKYQEVDVVLSFSQCAECLRLSAQEAGYCPILLFPCKPPLSPYETDTMFTTIFVNFRFLSFVNPRYVT